MAPSAQPSSRDRILDAAERLVAQTGASHLTLDAVAQAAGVSKGGLLYHFPTKEALLEGMIERHFDAVERRVAELRATDDVRASNPVVALLTALFETVGPEKRAVGAALIAASATNPALMTPCRAHYAETLRQLESLPCGFDEAALILLAADGLVLGELIQLSPYTPEQRERLVAALLKRAAACSTPT
jgi:AcrR family transcriptional regulator